MTKKLFISFLFIISSLVSFAQSGTKVKWNFVVKKLADKKYEVRMIASIQAGWHLYSQIQSKDAIALPTKISFAKNPLIVATGVPKEEGKLNDTFDKATNSRSRYYANKVEFVQIVTVKSTAKTSVVGDIEFMVCDDSQCLPPDKTKFTVKLEG